ncbi:MAG: cell envelope integrity protein CreD [Treponema sp.]|jgi:inner membrane protein|nr:cell envelope integrity protein CreD [Treponema sp.]
MKHKFRFTGSGGFKALLITLVILPLLIPAAMIRDLIQERSRRAEEVKAEIMESWGGRFLLLGPVIQIPLEETSEIKTKNSKGEERIELRIDRYYFRLVPRELKVRAELKSEIKKRGIFSAPLFFGTVRLSGYFDPGKIAGELRPNQKIFPEKAELVIALSSQRSVRRVDEARWNGAGIDFLPGGRELAIPREGGGREGRNTEGIFCPGIFCPGIFCPVPLAGGDNGFEITLSVQGGESLRMAPIGEDSSLSVKADWPSPSFQGSYLPVTRSHGAQGFEAEWEISRLSRNIPVSWTRTESVQPELYASLFGVDFFQALDHYDLATRAAKYAVLFLIIPFLCLFLLETLLCRHGGPEGGWGLSPGGIHPAQYLLSGIGNLIFYLLLLSFSEHLPFAAAYWIASSSAALMTGCYSRSLLGAWDKSLLMFLVMLLCYGFLYFTLQSEDWALLIGSVGAFVITGAVMFFTRKLDWYGRKGLPPGGLSGHDTPPEEPPENPPENDDPARPLSGEHAMG